MRLDKLTLDNFYTNIERHHDGTLRGPVDQWTLVGLDC